MSPQAQEADSRSVLITSIVVILLVLGTLYYWYQSMQSPMSPPGAPVVTTEEKDASLNALEKDISAAKTTNLDLEMNDIGKEIK